METVLTLHVTTPTLTISVDEFENLVWSHIYDEDKRKEFDKINVEAQYNDKISYKTIPVGELSDRPFILDYDITCDDDFEFVQNPGIILSETLLTLVERYSVDTEIVKWPE